MAYWNQKSHPKYEVSIKALIYNSNEKLFFAKDEKGKWDLPGGRIDDGERVEDCLRREVKEELGVEIKAIENTKVAELIDYEDGEKRLLIGIQIEVENFNFKSSDENIENGFFSKEEFDQLDQSYEGLRIIKDKFYD